MRGKVPAGYFARFPGGIFVLKSGFVGDRRQRAPGSGSGACAADPDRPRSLGKIPTTGFRAVMNENQYNQILKNRRPVRFAPLFDGAAARNMLMTAARTVRRRKAAQRVLETNLPPRLLAGCVLGAYSHGRLELEARDALSYAELRAKKGWLEQRLRRTVPGIRTLILRPPGWQPPVEPSQGESTSEVTPE